MYKPNKKHLQPLLISNVNDLPAKHRQRLETSWAGVFYRDFFCRLKEEPFARLYADVPSRPNIPVNVLVGLESLKAGFGWSDEELYDHFVFDLQVRYALGYRDLKEGEFELRTLYNFRQRLSRYYQESGVNLLAQAFEDITDQQLTALKLATGIQRMDSTQMASNILEMSRLQLLVEGLQRVWRILEEAEQHAFEEWLGAYVQSGAGQYVYRVKGKAATAAHTLKVGQAIDRLLAVTREKYAKTSAYQVLTRLFEENFNRVAEEVAVKPNDQISSGCLQSVDDLEATFRRKGPATYKGYVANLTQTCDEHNPVQLITKVQVAPNNVDDGNLLAEALPDLKARTAIETLYADGAYGNPAADEILNEHQVELIQTGIRGNAPAADKLSLSEFEFTTTAKGRPLTIRCPNGQQVPVEPGRSTGFIARFDPQICESCPFGLADRCKAKPGKKNPAFTLRFTRQQVNWARRRRRYELSRQPGKNPRAAVEAAVRSVKHPFPAGKLPVRGLFRVTSMVISSAAMSNVRSIHRFESKKNNKESQQSDQEAFCCLILNKVFWSLCQSFRLQFATTSF
jgi:hypothetical protein